MSRRPAVGSKFFSLPWLQTQPASPGSHTSRTLSSPFVKLLERLRLRETPPAEVICTPHPSLLGLPLELLEEIFLLACAEGGRTACSLALVSKEVNSISRIARFHVVSLLHDGCGCYARRLLLSYQAACVQAEAEEARRPRIRHLAVFMEPLVSNTPDFAGDRGEKLRGHMAGQERACCPAKAAWIEDERARYLSKKDREYAADKALSRLIESYVKSVLDLLAEVANDVDTLVLLRHQWRRNELPQWHRIPVLLSVYSDLVFPELRELWLFRESCVQDKLTNRAPRKDRVFPNLRRLHVVEPDYDADFARFVHDAPALETFRICDASFDSKVPSWIKSLGTLAANNPQWPRLRPTQVLIDPPLFWPARPSAASFYGRQWLYHHANVKKAYATLRHPDTRIVFVPYCLPNLVLSPDATSNRITDEATVMRDWLARVSQSESSVGDSEFDGVYIREFWQKTRHGGEGQQEDEMQQLIMSGQLGAEVPYLPPLVQDNPVPRARGRRRVKNGDDL